MVFGVQWKVGLLIERNDIPLPRHPQGKVKYIDAVRHQQAMIPTFVEVDCRRFGLNVFSL